MISDDLDGIAKHMKSLADERGRLRLDDTTTRAVLELLTTVAGQIRTLERNRAAVGTLRARAPSELEDALVRIGAQLPTLTDDVAGWPAGAAGDDDLALASTLVGEIAGRLERLYARVEEQARPRPTALGEGVVDLAARRAARRTAAVRNPGPDGGAA